MVNYFPRQIDFMPTFSCTANCGICGVEKGSKDSLPDQTVYSCIDQARKLGIKEACFTGGEPLKKAGGTADRTLRFIEYAGAKGMASVVVSNASYAKSRWDGGKMAKDLKKAGLGRLFISVDADHREFVPEERWKHAIEGALSNDLGISLNVVDRKCTKNENRLIIRKLAADLGGYVDDINGIVLPSGKQIPFRPENISRAGEALKLEESEFELKTVGEHASCDSDHMIVRADSEIVPCCSFQAIKNNYYSMGSADDISLKTAIKRTNRSILGKVIMGPAGLGRLKRVMMNSGDPEVAGIANGLYTNKCEFCDAISRHSNSRKLVFSRFHEYMEAEPEIVFDEGNMASEETASVIVDGQKIRFMDFIGPIDTTKYFVSNCKHELVHLKELEDAHRIDLSFSKKILREQLERVSHSK